MRFHTSTTRYHCGIDLHSRQMYVCVMDSQGNKLLYMNIKNNDFEFFLKKIAPWRHDITQDVHLVMQYDIAIKELEKELLKITKSKQPRDFTLLRSIPGVGKTLALTILYEMESIDRFPSAQNFLSYCRLVKGTVASAGKIKGLRGAKLGNPYLRWAFGEAAVLGKRHHEDLDAYSRRLEKKHGKFKGNSILASKLARATYFMLKNGTSFDLNQLTGQSATTH